MQVQSIAAMSTIDSEAYFDGRLAAVGVSSLVAVSMRRMGWNTLASFAYSSSFVPGQGDDTAFVEGVLKRLLGEDYLERG